MWDDSDESVAKLMSDTEDDENSSSLSRTPYEFSLILPESIRFN